MLFRSAVVVFRHSDSADWRLLARTVLDAFADGSIPVLDLGEYLAKMPFPVQQVHYPLDGHPNELAYEVAARALSEFLSRRNLLPKGTRR